MVQSRPRRGRPLWSNESPADIDEPEHDLVVSGLDVVTADRQEDRLPRSIYIEAGVWCRWFGLDPSDPDVARMVVRAAHEAWRANVQDMGFRSASTWLRQQRPEMPSGDVVYYMRIGNRVKIGVTGNLKNRMATINPEELLATEPGDARLEAKRHSEFRSLHTHGEWFRFEDPLTAHIARLQSTAGRCAAS